MRLSNAAYRANPWRIASIAPDFKLQDAWDLHVEGSRGDFDNLLDIMEHLNPSQGGPPLVRTLFRLRDRMGRWFGWNDGGWGDGAVKLAIPGCPETTLSVRLPEDLKNTVAVSDAARKFRPLYRADGEWAAELSNNTVHAIMHLVWIDQGKGRYRGQMGVYVKPRGAFGSLYMALIGPFRRVIVYPAIIRQVKIAWDARVLANAQASRA